MALKIQITNRILPEQLDTPWQKKDGGRLDFTLGLKRGKQIGTQIKQIMDAIRPVLGYNLGYDENMDMWEFLKSIDGQQLVRQLAEEYYNPGTFRTIRCDEDGRLLVRNMWANTWAVQDVTLTGGVTIDPIVAPSSDEITVIIQNLSAANVVYVGWSAVSAVGFIELAIKQIIQIPNARGAMYAIGTAGEHVITQRGGF